MSTNDCHSEEQREIARLMASCSKWCHFWFVGCCLDTFDELAEIENPRYAVGLYYNDPVCHSSRYYICVSDFGALLLFPVVGHYGNFLRTLTVCELFVVDILRFLVEISMLSVILVLPVRRPPVIN